MMKGIIREIAESEKDEFNKVVDHPVQSWEWGNFRTQTGNKVLRLGRFEGIKLTQGYLITIHKIPKTKYFLGMFTQGPKPTQEMLDTLKELAKRENLIFIRMEPKVKKESPGFNILEVETLLIQNGARRGRPFFNSSTYYLDLTKSEEEILKGMHPKTRYNIKVAERHGVEVVEDNSDNAFQKYLDLMDETTRRQAYFAHTEMYHKNMWGFFKPSGIAHLLTARYKGKLLATWILFTWHKFLYYPYGASSQENREVMATTKMMWEAIKFGKKMGLETFDLWGADEGTGYARFKQSFGPELIEMIGTWDLVINKPAYHLYRVAEEARWKILKAKAKIFRGVSSFR